MIDEMQAVIRSGLATGTCFQAIQDHIRVSAEKPCKNVGEFKRRTTTAKGNQFEIFCQLYLDALVINNNKKQFLHVWLLKDVPDAVLLELGLTRRDVGIDLILEEGREDEKETQTTDQKSRKRSRKEITSRYWAVQAKYRLRRGTRKIGLSWKQLSTFYSICARTGPWVKHLVMTNCDFVRRMGKRVPGLDLTFAHQKFCSTARLQWLRMAAPDGELAKGHTMGEEKTIEEKKKPISIAQMRSSWLEKLNVNKKQSS